MIIKDGLYLNNVWVCTADVISETHQGNDLTKPDTLQTSYTNSFTIPDSLAVRKLLENAEQLDSGSKLPYNPLRAKVIRGGEVTFSGIAQLSSFSAGWEIELYEEKRDLFTRLDRSLQTLELSNYDHAWTVENINRYANATDGLFYPLIDYGLLKNGIQPLDTVFPAIFVKTILARALAEEGYTLTGSILDDELYKRLFIPFSESEPTNYDEQWQIDRFARVTMQRLDDEVSRGALGKSNWLDRIQPYNLDNIDTFYQGSLKNYNTQTYAYVCDTAMNLKVEASQKLKAMSLTGVVEIILSIVKNGQDIGDGARLEAPAGYNLLFLREDILNLRQTVKCKAGDRIQIRLQARRMTKVGNYHIVIFNDPDSSFVNFTPMLTTSFGDIWKTARNLPDLTAKAVMVAIAYQLCGTWEVDSVRHQVQFNYFDEVPANIDKAVDWSYRIDTSSEIKWTPRIDPYGQINLLTWKETDEAKKAGRTIGKKLLNYGDGIITVNAPVLDAEVTLFEMPFGASTNSEESIPGYGNPVLVKLRSVSGRGESLNINNQNTAPRLLLASLDGPFPVNSTQLKDDGVTVEPVVLQLKPCWFGQRPDVVSGVNTQFSLSFGPLGIARGEVCSIERYYGSLQRVLRRMRAVGLTMRLYPNDIAGIDYRLPIRLQRVQVGAITISDGYYYLNRVGDYQSDSLAQVALIAF
ncbi:hypothetical protein [Spirosoma aerophilum]